MPMNGYWFRFIDAGTSICPLCGKGFLTLENNSLICDNTEDCGSIMPAELESEAA